MCLASCFKIHLLQIFMYTALSIGANFCNDLNKPAEERWSFQTIWYSAAPTVTITSRLVKHVISISVWSIYPVSKSSWRVGGEKFQEAHQFRWCFSPFGNQKSQFLTIHFTHSFFSCLYFFVNLNSAWFPSTSPEDSEVPVNSLLSTFSFLVSSQCHWSHVLRKRINLENIPILWSWIHTGREQSPESVREIFLSSS